MTFLHVSLIYQWCFGYVDTDVNSIVVYTPYTYFPKYSIFNIHIRYSESLSIYLNPM